MSEETATQGLPILQIGGGLNDTASPLATPLEDSPDLNNVVVTQEKTIELRRSFDFIGTGDTYKDETWTLGGEDPSPAAFSFSTELSTGEYKKYVFVHLNTDILIYSLDNLLNLADLGTPTQTLDISSYGDADMGFYHSVFMIDRGKVLFVNPATSVLLIQLNGSDVFVVSDIDIRDRDLDSKTKDSIVTNDDADFICVKSHTSSAATEPGVGADWKEYWARWGAVDGNADGAWATATAYDSNTQSVTVDFSIAEVASGRLWVAGGAGKPNTIYFSQSVLDDEQYGRMHALADPLNKNDSAVVDSDGGTIIVNGAERILALKEFKGNVLVFANNGVWTLGGSGSDVFRATDFSINRVSEAGIVAKNGVVQVEEKIIYFSYGDVYLIEWDDLTGAPAPKILSSKIRNTYVNIPIENKIVAKAIYNQSEKKVYFWCNFNRYSWNTRAAKEQPGHFRDALVFDVTTGAWYPYSLETDTVGDNVSIYDVIPTALGTARKSYVLIEDGSYVKTSGGDYVLSQNAHTGSEEYLNLLLVAKRTGETNFLIAFATTDGPVLEDFSRNSADASSYTWRYFTPHINFQEIANDKITPYLAIIFERIKGSSCKMAPAFNFNTGSRVGTQREIYRENKWNIGKYDGAAADRETVIVQEAVRGRGKAVQFQFSGTAEKDCHILGFQLDVNGIRG